MTHPNYAIALHNTLRLLIESVNSLRSFLPDCPDELSNHAIRLDVLPYV